MAACGKRLRADGVEAEPTEAPSLGLATRARTTAAASAKLVVLGAKTDVTGMRRVVERMRPRHGDVPTTAPHEAESSAVEAQPATTGGEDRPTAQ
jgi:hypothetical protein